MLWTATTVFALESTLSLHVVLSDTVDGCLVFSLSIRPVVNMMDRFAGALGIWATEEYPDLVDRKVRPQFVVLADTFLSTRSE